MTTIDSAGWTVQITHPETERVREPDVLNVQDAPAQNPGPNTLPRVRIPVRKSEEWLSEDYEDDPEMAVWKDGRRLPIEVLRDVEQREGVTILIGVGGVELEQRAQREYNNAQRHLAAEDLIDTETTYASDTPAPDVSSVTDVQQQEADTTAEFEAIYSATDTNIIIEGDQVRAAQVAWTDEGELADRSQFGFDNTTNELKYSGGNYYNGSRGPGAGGPDYAEWDFTPSRDIPADDFGCQVRDAAATSDGAPAFEWTLIHPGGGEYVIDELSSVGVGLFTEPGWTDIARGAYDNLDGYTGPDLSAGETHTLRVEITDSNGEADTFQYNVDCVAPYDAREESALSFPDETSGGEALDGPAWFVPQTATFDAAPSAFNVVGGRAEIFMNDTSGGQRLQLSNDDGMNWVPNDGSEENTETVDVTYVGPGSSSQMRVTFDGHSPNGSRNRIPAENYASQELYAFDLYADISQELLLIEETFDNSIASILTDIAEPAERSWRFAYDDGLFTVRFVKNGQFVGDYAPEFTGRTREKLGKTYQKALVKGSHEPVSNEPYTADTTFTPLVRDDILPGSETVYDDSQNYQRGTDYEMNYREGELRILSSGSMTDGNAYRVDYRYQARGSFESPDAPDDADELVETVPGITSTRLAEQVAFVLVSNVSSPRYAAEVTIPEPDPRFDPTDALPPEALGLPEGVGALEVRGDPELTPAGLRVRFGTRPAVDATLQRLSRQVSRVTDRS